MLRNSPASPFSPAHISLALVGLMWVLPFLYYHHAYPLTTFYQEWWAALLGLSALPLLLAAHGWQSPQLPRIVLLPIGMLLLAMVQFLLERIVHLDHLLLLSLYLLFAALLIMLGQRLRGELGLPVVVTALAVFLLVGAELNTLAGILQHYRWDTFLNSVVTVKTSSAVYGNTAQPNHYANYLTLGLISLGLLTLRWRMRLWQAALLAAPMLFVMVLSGSRSSWLYLLFTAGLAFMWQRRDRVLRPLLYYALALLAGFALLHLVVQIPWLAGSASVTTVERLLGDNASGGIRLQLWHEAALIFAQSPLLGAGFGEFAWEHLKLAGEMRNPVFAGLYNNAHNLPLQIAAEGGLLGLVVLFGAAALWLWQTRDSERDIYHWWGFAVLAVLAIHSLLEYPLWYSYFMGIAAVTLGIFERSSFRLEMRGMARLSVAAILLLGALALLQLLQGYRQLEAALQLRGQAVTDRSLVPRAHAAMLAVQQNALLGSYAEMYLANVLDPGAEQAERKLALNEHALRFIPTASLAYHQAWLLAWSDRPEEARAWLERAVWSYPAEYATARNELDELARKDPARFAPLLEFATQKIEEYRRAAVSGK